MPFWFWNGQEEEGEITHQLEMMAAQGISGVTIHARTGNSIPYLSKRWMELVAFACAECHRLQMQIWLYDEDGFPSGKAGGLLLARHPECRRQALHFQKCPGDALPPASPDEIALFSMDDLMHPIQRDLIREDREYLVFTREFQNDMPDFLKRDTALQFIAITHDAFYLKP